MFRLFNQFKPYLLGLAIIAGTSLHGHQAHAATDSIVVAGGCFWCVEADFEKVKGVKEVTSGYAGGKTKNPTYKEVTRGGTGHYEVVKIDFDPSVITIDSVLHMFLRSVDPTDAGGQFCDRGESYRTAIFPNGAAQKSAAQKAIKDAQSDLGQTVVTPIVTLGTFYEAEGYHQNYYKGDDIVLTRFGPRKQSKAYELYRDACGRDKRVKQLWGPAAPFAK